MMGHDDHAGGHGGHAHGSISAGGRHQGRLLAAFLVLAVFMVVEVVGGMRHRLAGPAVRRRAHAHRRHRHRHGAGRHPPRRPREPAHPPHVRAVPPGDPRRPGQLGAAARRRRLRAGRGDPPVRATRPTCSAGRCSSSPSPAWPPTSSPSPCCARGAKESLNVEGAYLEVLADTVGSVGVIVGAVVIAADRVDVGRPRRRRRHRRSGSCPARCASPARPCASSSRPRRRAPTSTRMRADLAAVDGVVDVHDLHVWTLTSDMDVASVHLMVAHRHRPPPRARRGPRHAARALRHRPRHAAGRARGPPRLRRGRLVSDGDSSGEPRCLISVHVAPVERVVQGHRPAGGQRRGCRVTTVER